jgi:outer membrane protein TolC
MIGQIEMLVERTNEALEKSERIERLRAQTPMEALNYQRELLEVMRTLQSLKQEYNSAKTELAVLMGLEPNTEFELMTLAEMEYALPEIKLDMTVMENTALMHRPELIESQYYERISAKDARAAMLSLLPGVSLSAGLYYDDNQYLKYNDWASAGAQVSWNLFNVFKWGKIEKVNELKQNFAYEQSMATAVAVLSQVHLATIRFHETLQTYQIADKYFNVSVRINNQIQGARRTENIGELEVIRENINLMLAGLRRDLAYAELQNSYGRVLMSMGLDLVDEGFRDKPLVVLVDEINQRLTDWQKGQIPVVQDLASVVQ